MTLDYWEGRLTAIPSTIECPEMCLIGGHNSGPPVFTGSGRIDITSSTDIDFTMYATATDNSDAVRCLVRARENPYEVFEQFVLEATDYRGTKWNCGWTQPEIKGLPNVGWPLTGHISSMVTLAKGSWVSDQSSIELVFQPKFWLPMDTKMMTVTSIDGKEIERKIRPGQQCIQIFDTELKCFYPPYSESVWLTANTSEKFQHPYAENWASEPFRILLGQLAYPRLVARNFGDGTAYVWLRPSYKHFSNSGFVSILDRDSSKAHREFWKLYASLLTLIAGNKDEKGHPNFEHHPITRFYEEIIQATQGSRWVLFMTLSSAAEGIVRLLNPPRKKVDIEYYMKSLVEQKVLVDENLCSWQKIRNAVMHGQLVLPWCAEEEDQRLQHLIDLVHRLTHELIRQKVSDEAVAAYETG